MLRTYELKRFRNSSSKDLTEAIGIYSKNIQPFLRTDTREILYWLDKYPDNHSDKFIILGLYLNNKVIGYAQFAYFLEERIIFVDYIVITPEFRKNNTFYEFVEEIKDFLDKQKYEFDFILAEIGGFDGNEPAAQTKNLIRLLKMTGFGVVKAPYFHPRLGKTNYESQFQSVLMLFSADEGKNIKKETYFMFLNTIYFKHYNRWYDAFLNEREKAEYANSLINLMARSTETLKKKTSIEINGYLHLYNANYSPPQKVVYKKVAKIIAVILLFGGLAFVFGILHLYLKNKAGIETTAQAYIAIAAGFALLFILLLRKERKTQSITSIIQKLIESFT